MDKTHNKPTTLGQLRDSDWQSKSVKQEMHDNLVAKLRTNEPLFPKVLGYDDTVIPAVCMAVLAEHDMLFLGEKGQAKSRLMRQLADLLDAEVPYIAGSELHDDPFQPLTGYAHHQIATKGDDTPIAWWRREDRYAERLAPGTKFADIIGEIDPSKLAQGKHMSAEDALHFGLIPRMNRGIFAMNEVPELDELVQVGLFNILEERDVQIRGYPIRYDLDMVILFSANPATYNRSGKVIPQLKDRIGSIIRTHYPLSRELGIDILEQEANIRLSDDIPVHVPWFMKEICEQMTICARTSDHIDHQSGVSARFSIANYKTMLASARRRATVLQERHAVPRISDLAHAKSSSMGKLELDMMSSHQMDEDQVLDGIQVEAIKSVFDEYADSHGFEEIANVFSKGLKIEVGDMLPSSAYEDKLRHIPPAWEKALEINRSSDPAVRASCVEFVLAGLYAREQISRATRYGKVTYET